MTGRDLIIYILQNGLEDEPIFKDGKFIGFMTPSEAAVKFDVSEATIFAWINLEMLEGEAITDRVYIPVTAEINPENLKREG